MRYMEKALRLRKERIKNEALDELMFREESIIGEISPYTSASEIAQSLGYSEEYLRGVMDDIRYSDQY